MLLESRCYDDNLFVTLTYSDDQLVYNSDYLPVICKHDVQTFFKRLRKALEPTKLRFRYFLCGEYGDQTERPHYHAILFGLSPLFSQTIADAWKHGGVAIGTVTDHSIQYVAGYTTKKLGAKRLDGRTKEFSMMSLRPAIGAPALEILKRDFVKYGVIKHNDDGSIDIPTSLIIGKKRFPLGRTLINKLYDSFGADRSLSSFLFEMRSRYVHSNRDSVFLPDGSFVGALARSLIDESSQRNKQISARFKIFNSRNKI